MTGRRFALAGVALGWGDSGERTAVKLRATGKVLGAIVLILGLALFGLWVTSPDPKFNPASFEDAELVPGLAPLEQAITLAQVQRIGGNVATLLVTALYGEEIRAIDLSRATDEPSDDPFAVLAAASDSELLALAGRDELTETYRIADLLTAAPRGTRHIGIGTNFPEHAAEASSDAVFLFPKFGPATPARTSVIASEGALLDYEVELCMRFDRPIASAEDFEAAKKGVFLCGDFTDRAVLTRMVDPDNLDSGSGFSDGKSGADFFPAGALLVVPRDWSSFVGEERFMTFINGERRQDARGGEMTLDFRGLAEKALGEIERPRFLYRGEYFKLAPEPRITPEMTLMSGTAEGVIFTAPSRADIIEGGLSWLLGAGWARGQGVIDAIKQSFVANELASGHFLQPGDLVEYRSTRLGTIEIKVTSDTAR